MKTARMSCGCGATLWFRDFNYWSDIQPVMLAWIKSHEHAEVSAPGDTVEP